MEGMKNKKGWITASLICVILGAALLTAGRLTGGEPGFHISKSGLHAAGETIRSETVRGAKELEKFNSIEIDVDDADVELVVSDRFAIEYCIMSEYGEPVCEVKNGRLLFKKADSFKIIDIGLFHGSLGITVNEPAYYVRVEIPENTKLSDVSINTESGNLNIPVLQSDVLKLKNEYGDITLKQYEGKKLDVLLESGSLSISSLHVAHAAIENAYGEVHISSAEGDSLTVNLESCNCQIDRLKFSSAKLENAYGDVTIGLPGNISSYGFDLYTEYGEILVGKESRGYNINSDEAVYQTSGNGQKKVSVSCESGNIEINSVK